MGPSSLRHTRTCLFCSSRSSAAGAPLSPDLAAVYSIRPQAKLERFHRLSAQGHAFNASLMRNKAFRNPHILDKLVTFVNVDESGSHFGDAAWDREAMLRDGSASVLGALIPPMLLHRRTFFSCDAQVKGRSRPQINAAPLRAQPSDRTSTLHQRRRRRPNRPSARRSGTLLRRLRKEIENEIRSGITSGGDIVVAVAVRGGRRRGNGIGVGIEAVSHRSTALGDSGGKREQGQCKALHKIHEPQTSVYK